MSDRRNKRGGLSSAVAAVAGSNNQSGSVSSGIGSSSPQTNGTEDRKPIAIYVKNLPARSSGEFWRLDGRERRERGAE